MASSLRESGFAGSVGAAAEEVVVAAGVAAVAVVVVALGTAAEVVISNRLVDTRRGHQGHTRRSRASRPLPRFRRRSHTRLADDCRSPCYPTFDARRLSQSAIPCARALSNPSCVLYDDANRAGIERRKRASGIP